MQKLYSYTDDLSVVMGALGTHNQTHSHEKYILRKMYKKRGLHWIRQIKNSVSSYIMLSKFRLWAGSF